VARAIAVVGTVFDHQRALPEPTDAASAVAAMAQHEPSRGTSAPAKTSSQVAEA
jgi:hypothetical protein